MTTTQSPFHYDALLVTCTSDRQERRQAIRELGKDIYDQYKTTASLLDFMQAAVDMRPDLQNELLGDFNGALNGIGYWMA